MPRAERKHWWGVQELPESSTPAWKAQPEGEQASSWRKPHWGFSALSAVGGQGLRLESGTPLSKWCHRLHGALDTVSTAVFTLEQTRGALKKGPCSRCL